MFSAVTALFSIIALGALCGALRLFPVPSAAIGVLNRYALYVAFPLLIAASLASDQLRMSHPIGFIGLHAAAACIYLPIVWLAARRVTGTTRRTLIVSTGAVFGNIAYLGIPFCTAVLGARATGIAAVSAAIHIVISMITGPTFLARAAEGGQGWGRVLSRVVKQPLVWSPFVGLLLRYLGGGADWFLLVARPVGASAGPVALFMLGLYLWENRTAVARWDADAALVCLVKLTLYPAITFALVAILGAPLGLSSMERQVLVLVAAMPVAITTFALAEEFRVGRRTLATAIVLSTMIGLASLSALALWIR